MISPKTVSRVHADTERMFTERHWMAEDEVKSVARKGRLRGGGQGPKVRRSREGHLCGPSGPGEGQGRVMGGRDAGTAPSGLDSLCRSLQPGTRRSHSFLLGGKHQ